MKTQFKRIASVLTSAVMLSSTVALAAAANYPDPFVKSGNADVAVVWGSNAALTDLVAVTDITSNLAGQLAAQTATPGSSSSGTTVSGGDYVLLAKSSDNLNLGNTMSGVFGTTVSDDDLQDLLADGTYLNDENTEYDFEQTLTLAALELTQFSDSDYNDKVPTVGFRIPSNTFVLNYTLDFTSNPESDVTSGDLVDFETTDLPLFGKTYYVSDADNSTLDLTLLDSANTQSIKEGETKTVTAGGKSYEVSIDFVSTSEVKLSVNGAVTNSLGEGQSYRLADGTYVGIKDISARDVQGSIASVEFSIGSGKLELINGQDIELNDDTISGLQAYVTRGTSSGGKTSIDKIVIQWKTDDDMFVTAEDDLAMPGFGAVKFSMAEFFTPAKELVTVGYSGDDTIELKVPIKDGTATFDILSANSSGEFNRIGGNSADEVLRTARGSNILYNVSSDERIVVSYNSSSDSESYLLDLEVNLVDNANKTDIKNVLTGKTVCDDKAASDTCNIGDVSLTITSVYRIGSEKTVNITGGTGVSFDKVFSKEGLTIYLPVNEVTTAGLGTINLTNTAAGAGYNSASWLLWFDEENKDDDIAGGTAFNVTLDDDSDGDVQVSDIDSGFTEHDIVGSDDDTVTMIESDLATMLTRKVASDRGQAEIEYHGGESYADAFLADDSATVSSGSGSTGSTGVKQLGTVAFRDSESSSFANKNLIVVGGSCVNSVAASLLGSSSPLCGDAFTSATTVGAGSFLIQTFSQSNGKVATLVAGYNAGDTTAAAKYLTTQPVNVMAGQKEVKTVASVASLI